MLYYLQLANKMFKFNNKQIKFQLFVIIGSQKELSYKINITVNYINIYVYLILFYFIQLTDSLSINWSRYLMNKLHL